MTTTNNKEIKEYKKQHTVSQFIIKEFSENKNEIFGIYESTISIKDQEYRKLELKLYGISKIMQREFCYEWPKIINEKNELSSNKAKKYLNFSEKEIFNQKLENEYKQELYKFKTKIENKKSIENVLKFFNEKMLLYTMYFYFKTAQFMCTKNDYNPKKETAFETKENIKKRRLIRLNFNILCDKLNKSHAETLTETIQKYYKPYILKSNNKNFLLSDTFISIVSIDFKGHFCKEFSSNRDIGLKNIVILIPISSEYYILYTDNDEFAKDKLYLNENKINVCDNNINFYNSIIFRNSYEITVGNKNALNYVYKNVNKQFILYTIKDIFLCKKEVWIDEQIDIKFYNEINIQKSTNIFEYYGNRKNCERPIDICEDYFNFQLLKKDYKIYIHKIKKYQK